MNDEHDIPKISCQYLGEPLLCFADGKQHIDPKFGVLNFGPKSYSPIKRHPSLVRVGFIGSAETIEIAKQWMEKTAQGVLGDDKHPAFPGFQKERGFFSELVFDDAWIGQLNRSEIEDVLKIKSERERFEAAVKLLESKLNLLSRKDQPPEYVVVALPEQLSKKCRVADYKDTELGDIHMDLRRAFKSMAMKYRIPTQLLNMETVNGRDKDHPSKIAWNFFTGLYFKAGGFPWGPVGLQPGSCYIGISFYRPLGSTFSTMQTSLVQAFDEHGDGLVLRGHEFTWDSKKEGTKSPHLTEEQAIRLVDMVLARYQEEMGQRPKRVVVHKTSRYWPAEKSGFEQALQKYVSQYDLLALIPQNKVRLLIANKYPPLRGTRFTVEDIDYLYTTGFIAELNQFHGMHVPSPIQIADHIGYDTPRETLLKEILILTKMNWNSSRLGGLLPITIRFSRLVGDIMREIPADREPLSNFKFYM
ncbi:MULTISPECIES: hypothetical protein [unclassified Microcoleus]|jgi:hypothetical protein|uniref:hypothetical protein n=1 Tax=unclassified Microcoleus TaxID=2642155 RepID=UPI002FD711B2